MLEWASQHPWMTFTLAFVALVVFESVVTSIFEPRCRSCREQAVRDRVAKEASDE